MNRIDGYYFSGENSQKALADLTFIGNNLCQVRKSGKSYTLNIATAEISTRLGNTPRTIEFEDGSTFETTANDVIDQYLVENPNGSHWPLLHLLETRWSWVLSMTVAVIAFVYLFITYGIPYTADVIAENAPASVHEQLGSHVLAALDSDLFEPTTLSAERQAEVRAAIAPALAVTNNIPITFHFRNSRIGANAFALPSGDVIFTDRLIELAESNDEILAILFHEIGHVHYRHGLQHIVQDGMLYWILSVAIGDFSGIAELLTAAPAVLLGLAYSRGMETEADDFALQQMQSRKMETHHFSTIMAKIVKDADVNGDDDKDFAWTQYLSTHPATQERLEKFDPHKKTMAQ